MPNTTRLSLPYPSLTDAADVPQDIMELAQALDAQTVIYGQGILSNRPASSGAQPGKQARFYYATDNGTLYYDMGTGWVTINAAQVSDGPAAQATLRSLGTGAQQAAAGNDPRFGQQVEPLDNSVTAAKINTSLKPSSGAGAGTEALRALGTGAGQAAPGTHVSQHRPGGSDVLTVPKCSLTNITGIDLTDGGVYYAVPWTTEVQDTAGMHAPNSANVVLPFAGSYIMTVRGNVITSGYTELLFSGSNIDHPGNAGLELLDQQGNFTRTIVFLALANNATMQFGFRPNIGGGSAYDLHMVVSFIGP